MTELPLLSSQKVVKILDERGFVLKRITGIHYIFAHPETDRRVSVPYHTYVARGTLLEILKEAGISRKELDDGMPTI